MQNQSYKNNLNDSNTSNNGLIKQGYLDLCYLGNVPINNINDSAVTSTTGLCSQPVLVSIHRRPGEFFAILQFQSGATSCLNLRHCRAESCENRRYLKLMFNDFTSGLLFRIHNSSTKAVAVLTKQNELEQQQLVYEKSWDELSIINNRQINQKSDEDTLKDEEIQIDWVKTFSEPTQSKPVKLCTSFGFRRSQSLQTVYESEEEELEDEKLIESLPSSSIHHPASLMV